jgi:hypothetical protein
MILTYYQNIEGKKPKKAGVINLTNNCLLYFTEKHGTYDNVVQSFQCKIQKHPASKNKYINAEIVTKDSTHFFQVRLTKSTRRSLYLMAKKHWYYDNLYTRFLVKYNKPISHARILMPAGFAVYKLIIAILGVWKMFG